jgi:hypothetical protein
MARKTIEVGKVLRMANTFLAAHHTTADERESMCLMMEAILFETDNYEGFRYLDITDPADGAGSRRLYFPSNTIAADYNAPLSNSNIIRV